MREREGESGKEKGGLKKERVRSAIREVGAILSLSGFCQNSGHDLQLELGGFRKEAEN